MLKLVIIEKNSEMNIGTHPQPDLFVGEKKFTAEGQHALKSLHRAKLQLHCQCSENGARMFVRCIAGKYTLVNHFKNGIHAQDCPLMTQIQSMNIDSISSLKPHTEAAIRSFLLHKNLAIPKEKTEGEQTQIHHTKQHHRSHMLEQLYFQLTKTSLLHFYYKNKRLSFAQCYNKMKLAGNTINFGRSQLSDFIFYGVQGLQLAKYITTSVPWDGPGRPHALCLLLCDNVTIKQKKATLFFSRDNDANSIVVDYKTNLTSLPSVPGPRLVILSVSLDADHQAHVYSFFSYPIYSTTHPIPVKSDADRLLYQQLIRLVDVDTESYSFFRPIVLSSSEYSLSNEVVIQKKIAGKVARTICITPTPSMKKNDPESGRFFVHKDELVLSSSTMAELIPSLHNL